jgi:hypothetical protein
MESVWWMARPITLVESFTFGLNGSSTRYGRSDEKGRTSIGLALKHPEILHTHSHLYRLIKRFVILAVVDHSAGNSHEQVIVSLK